MNEAASPDDMLTTMEAAKLLGVSGRTLQGWRSGQKPQHAVPKYYPIGSVVRYRRADLEKYLEEVARGGK